MAVRKLTAYYNDNTHNKPVNMKKLLLSFLPLLLTVLCGFQASAFSTTVTWEIPGSVKLYEGNPNPALSPKVIPLGADQTSITLTTKDKQYYFIGDNGYKLEGATRDGVKMNFTTVDNIQYYKVSTEVWDDFDGTSSVLSVSKIEYTGSFTLNIINGENRIKSLKLYPESGGSIASRYLEVKAGKNIIPITANEGLLWLQKIASADIFHTVAVDGTTIASSGWQYKISPITNGSTVTIAYSEPTAESTEATITVKFTNNNPECLKSLTNWIGTSPSFIKNYTEPFKIEKGTQLSFNLNSDYTPVSLTANGQAAAFATKLTVNEDTEFIVNVSEKDYGTTTAVLYTNNIEALSFRNNSLHATAGAITIKDEGEVAAGTVTFGKTGFTINEPTHKYTLGNISLKYHNVFFEVADGYMIKESALNNKDQANITGAAAFDAEYGPAYINLHKVNYTDPIYVYYEGPAKNARMKAKYCVTFDTSVLEQVVSYEGAGDNNCLTPGWNVFKIDPEINNTFEISSFLEDDIENYSRIVYVDGVAYDYPDGESFVSTTAIKKGSIVKVFLTPVLPAARNVNFITAGDLSGATITYNNGYSSTADFSTPIVEYGATEFTISGSDLSVTVNGQASNGTFTAAEGQNNVAVAKANYETLPLATDIANGATVRSLSTLEILIPMSFTEDGTRSAALVDGAEKWIQSSHKISSVTIGDPTETAVPVIITFADQPQAKAKAVTAASEVTVSIPAGIIYETVYDEATDTFIRPANAKVNAPMDLNFTVDPTLPLTWSFDPANGSENDLPAGNVVITLSLSDAKSIDKTAMAEAAGPWITFAGAPVKKVEDADEELGWSYFETSDNIGKPVVAFNINKGVFTKAGELTITANEGAFTVNGVEASPAVEYAATFGHNVEYSYTLNPADGTDIEDWKTITVTFPEAETVAYNSADAVIYFHQGNTWAPIETRTTVSCKGNAATITFFSGVAPEAGKLDLLIDAGSFIIDGAYQSPEITASYTYVVKASLNWQASPTGAIIPDGYGLIGTIVFDQGQKVAIANESAIVVKLNDVVIDTPFSWDDVDTMGYMYMAEANSFAFGLMGGEAYNTSLSGKLTIIIPAGALTISGTPTAETIEYTWKIVGKREFTYELTPAAGTTVPQINVVTIEFPTAATATVTTDEYFGSLERVNLMSGWKTVATAQNVTAVAGAEHPTFRITFPLVNANGTYTLNIIDGFFILDEDYYSPKVAATYKVDINTSLIDGVETEGQLFTVYNMQGILVLADGTADQLAQLPAGIYIVNGAKVALK